MSLPTPKLDDIDFETLRNDAISRIPHLCPTWTDFNPSDPGITLIELMAGMSELMLYRLNRIPEKNFITFLELMGVKLAPPRPARSWVVFELAKGAGEEALPLIEAGTRVSTKPGGGEPVVFETTEPLNLTTAHIKALCSRVGDRVKDHTRAMQEGNRQEIFDGETRVSHCLYMGDVRFEDLPTRSRIVISFRLKEQPEARLLEIEWEAWDGMAWAPLHADDGNARLRSSGEISFQPGFTLERCAVDGKDSVWLRARLLSAEGDEFPTLSSFKAAVSLAPEHARLPDAVFQLTSTQEGPAVYQSVNLGAEFEPFGKLPKPGNALYIISPILGRRGAKCRVCFVRSLPPLAAEHSAVEKVAVSWEYWCADEEWRPLGTDRGLRDETNALTREGNVGFIVPPDVAQLPPIQGQSGYAIRACLNSDAGSVAAATWPAFSAIRISFEETAAAFQACMSENYGAFQEIDLDSPFQPFVAQVNQGPTFCLALGSRPANLTQRIYFQLDEQPEDLPPRVVWEYWTAGEWRELRVLNDTTRGLSTKGALDFVAPADWESNSPELGIEGYWMRARREFGELLKASVLQGLYLNATEVMQARAIKGVELGSGNGEPFQTFSFETAQGAVLPGVSLLVRELENPTPEDVQHLRERLHTEVVEERDAAGNMTAVSSRWHEVENFFASGPDDCHYTFDQRRGTITFGDGRQGRIPPNGRGNVVVERYYEGGGAHGNVGQNTITVLEVAKDFVKAVRNVEPAQGGTDAETIESAKLRGPWALRHRYRAVTREDFEHLAKEASAEVALAKCFTSQETATLGEGVLVVIVPNVEEFGARPRPSSRIIQTVRSYLDERRLLTTRLGVVGPEYDDLVIEIDVALATQHVGRFPQIRAAIESKLKSFFDPLSGGPEGVGWPMGRTVHISELYYLLEQVEGVDYVDRLRMREYCAAEGEWKEKIKIGKRSFPYCRQIEIRQV